MAENVYEIKTQGKRSLELEKQKAGYQLRVMQNRRQLVALDLSPAHALELRDAMVNVTR